jgi:hypothetical protein
MLGKLELERVQSAIHSEVSIFELAHALEYPWIKTHPDELRNPPELKELRTRLGSYLATQLGSPLSQCGPTPSAPEALAIEAVRLAVDDMQIIRDDDANDLGTVDAHQDDEPFPGPAYLDELDRHMRELARENELLSNGMALPSDTQPLVDYWLLRNYPGIEATRRDLQVAKLVEVLTNEGVRRARGHAMRQLDDCVHCLSSCAASPLTLAKLGEHGLKIKRCHIIGHARSTHQTAPQGEVTHAPTGRPSLGRHARLRLQVGDGCEPARPDSPRRASLSLGAEHWRTSQRPR